MHLQDAATGATHACPLGRQVVIGRANPAAPPTIGIDDPSVSRCHCELYAEPQGWLRVVDRSTYGTWINGERLSGEGVARPGDTIVVGSGFSFLVQEGPAQPADAGPTRFGERYRVVRQLAQGSMGIVYEALEEETGRPWAVKLLKGSKAKAEQVKRFQREIELGKKLADHPGIVAIVDSGVTETKELYCVMELVEGKPLNERILAGLELNDAVRIVAEVSRAVAHAHAQGVIHRDLKPQNVIVTPGDEPRLTDFGVAKALDDLDGLTATGAVMGTVTYMAPEQVEDSKRVDERSDVYGLGAILYAAITRRTPLDLRGLNMRQALKTILAHDVDPPSRWVRKIDAALDQITMKALARRPDDRYPDAAALAEALEAWLAGDRTAPPETQSPEDEDHPGVSSALILGVSFLVVVAILVALFLALRK